MSDSYEEAFKEGFKAGHAAGYAEGKTTGYDQAKERVYLAIDIWSRDPILSRQMANKIAKHIETQVGAR